MKRRFPACPVTLAPLPWREDFSLDRDMFFEELELIRAKGRFAVYYGCTAGEGYALSHRLFAEVSAAFAQALRGYEHPCFVSVISASLLETIERVEFLKTLGIRTVMFPLPSWCVLRPEEIQTCFDALLGAHRDCSFIYYNNMRSKTHLTPQMLERLARRHPNLVAVKQAFGHPYDDARNSLSADTGLAEIYLDFVYPYACRYSSPNFMPSTLASNLDVALEYADAGARKDYERLQAIDAQIDAVEQALRETLPMDRIDGAYDKLFFKCNLPRFPQRLLPPYEGFSDEQFHALRAAIDERLSGWLPR